MPARLRLIPLWLTAWLLLGCTNPAAPADLARWVYLDNDWPNPHTTWPGEVAVIGHSTQGRPIEAYTTGIGARHVIFVGGIHGGYEWNSVLLAHTFMDQVTSVPDLLPDRLKVTFIPVANPDGLAKVVGQAGRFSPDEVSADTVPGRFNANDVDLNRNWECQWSASATWRNVEVSGGSAPFSEPETRALRDYFLATQPAAVVFWHSAAPGVFAAGCDEPFAASVDLARVYADAAGYPFAPLFNAYQVTGDAGDWLSLQGIPAITVELTNRSEIDWVQNLAGVKALLDFLSRPVNP